MSVLLLSAYDLGRQPFGLASPAAWLAEAGAQVECVDLSISELDPDTVRRASLIAVYLPMHTATRIVMATIPRIRELNPDAHLCAYGLYAPLTAAPLRASGVETVLGPEFERDLTRLWSDLAGSEPLAAADGEGLARLRFRVPRRVGLPPLSRYAGIRFPDGEERTVGATETTRGCLHGCRHCPIVPIYQRALRVVPVDVVLADIDQLVDAGAEHICFGDPDFLNGPGHAMRIVSALHRRHPRLSYDVTVKVEHLLRDKSHMVRLRDTGCCLVTSAIESFDDEVLELLDKGHTEADVTRLASLCESHGIALQPTFIAFHPWMTLEGYRDFLARILDLGWGGSVSPVQLAIRLLVPAGSELLTLARVRDQVEALDPTALAHPWRHPDPRVDRLQAALEERLATSTDLGPAQALRAAWTAVHALLERAAPEPPEALLPDRATIPYLTEPWYC